MLNRRSLSISMATTARITCPWRTNKQMAWHPLHFCSACKRNRWFWWMGWMWNSSIPLPKIHRIGFNHFDTIQNVAQELHCDNWSLSQAMHPQPCPLHYPDPWQTYDYAFDLKWIDSSASWNGTLAVNNQQGMRGNVATGTNAC
jgi:hypothetical protein